MQWTKDKIILLGFNPKIDNFDIFVLRWLKIGNRYKIIHRNTIDKFSKILLIEDKAWEEVESEGIAPLTKGVFKYKCNYKVLKASEYESFLKRRLELFKIPKETLSHGVYAIYVNDELYYIGMTMRSFVDRWKEHLEIIEGKVKKPKGMILYNYINLKKDKVNFKILIDINTLKTEGEITERDVKAMELALITTMKPKYNYAGVKGSYRW